MKELSYEESLSVEGGKASTVLSGLGIAAIGVACMVSSTVSVPLFVAGYALYGIGTIVVVGGANGG